MDAAELKDDELHEKRMARLARERAELTRLKAIEREATATAASIRTRCGQITNAIRTAEQDPVAALDRIEAAKGALETAALDLENALRRAPGEPTP